jgi:diaminopimelate epimerase
MMSGMVRFAKGHGTGNDFVVLPDPDATLPLTPHLVAALCDRHRGIGGDGVLRVVRAAAHPEAAAHAGAGEWFMDYWNCDGSFAEMCGNGVRVFVRYLVDAGLAEAGRIPVVTRAGVVVAEVGPGAIAATMPVPRVYAESSATVRGQTLPGTAVDVGNPHLVCPTGELAALDLSTVPRYDPILFPAGVNVEFSTLDPGPVDGADVHVRMRVFERGSGETQSCGSGACAVAAVALRDAGRDGGCVAVDVPGGRLTVTISGGRCWLAGPAVIVATGTIDLSALVGAGGSTAAEILAGTR